MKDRKLLMVGCGKMGGALLGGVLPHINRNDVLVIEPQASLIREQYQVTAIEEFEKVTVENFRPDAVMFGIKPQMADEILPKYAFLAPETLFLSIMAGKTVSYLENKLGNGAAVIRTMPNLPVSVGQGASALFANNSVNEWQRGFADAFFSCAGDAVWLENEEQMDAVTAISGSGPAYIFHLIECFVAAGKKLGLTEDIALRLAQNTIAGSTKMAMESQKSSKELREQVTSPNGTTQAALDVLMGNDALLELMRKTTYAAYKRSKELGG